jgi:hypothetical protein
MKFKEKKRRHGDVHWPLGGRGKKATKPKSKLIHQYKCNACGSTLYIHLCSDTPAKLREANPTSDSSFEGIGT